MLKRIHCLFYAILISTGLNQWNDQLVYGQFGKPWEMHTIDRTSRGADGVRLGDVNQDGLLDVVTGWEEGGVIRVYRNPGPKNVKSSWPSVTVGKVQSPEDAVFADLDGDGKLDVVSCCEGKNQTVYFHWAPKKREDYFKAEFWKTVAVPVTRKKAQWMFALPSDIDGKFGIDLFIGSKGGNAEIAWLQAPANPRLVADWSYHSLHRAGWIMSLRLGDMDQDGKLDLLASDRKGRNRGVFFLKQPQRPTLPWQRREMPGPGQEWMFLDVTRDKSSLMMAAATRNGQIVEFSKDISSKSRSSKEWSRRTYNNPFDIKHGKAVAYGDIDLDGQMDLVHTTNTGVDPRNIGKPAVSWLSRTDPIRVSPISIAQGKKFDRIELLDLDGDGDLDVLTCEEAANLGVIWFENPLR